jgi:hypothetical protein
VSRSSSHRWPQLRRLIRTVPQSAGRATVRRSLFHFRRLQAGERNGAEGIMWAAAPGAWPGRQSPARQVSGRVPRRQRSGLAAGRNHSECPRAHRLAPPRIRVRASLSERAPAVSLCAELETVSVPMRARRRPTTTETPLPGNAGKAPAWVAAKECCKYAGVPSERRRRFPQVLPRR